MNLERPTEQRSLTHEAWIAEEAKRMRWQREKAAQRRKKQVVYYDDETVLAEPPPKPTECMAEGCGRAVKARGLCERDYKRSRRAQGRVN